MTAMIVKQVITKEVNVPDLGDRIKSARDNCPKTLESLCREVDFSKTYWYAIESGFIKGGLSIETLRKIESALGVDFGVVIE